MIASRSTYTVTAQGVVVNVSIVDDNFEYRVCMQDLTYFVTDSDDLEPSGHSSLSVRFGLEAAVRHYEASVTQDNVMISGAAFDQKLCTFK